MSANPVHLNASIEDLCAQLLIDKEREDDVKLARLRTEIAIVDKVGRKDEGAETFEIGGHKLTIEAKMSRNIDRNALEDLLRSLGSDERGIVQSAIRYKPELNKAQYRELESSFPQLRKKLDQVVTKKPQKTAVQVKKI